MTNYGNYNNPNLDLWRNQRGYSTGSADGAGSAGGLGSAGSAGSAGYSTSCGSLNDCGSAANASQNRHVDAQVVVIHRGDNAEQRAKSYCKQNGIDVNKYPEAYNAVLKAFQSMIAQLNKLNKNMNDSIYFDNRKFNMPAFDY